MVYGSLNELKRDLEALLFAAGRPLPVDDMLRALQLAEPGDRGRVEEALHALRVEFPADGNRGFELIPLAGGYVFRTSPGCRAAVAALFELPDDAGRLSPAAMECLTIVAYLQPVSRPQIVEVRGVNSDSPVHTLLERELITEVGRAHGGGGAVLYGTTQRFEAMFGLSSLEELPALEGFALGEEQKEDLRRRLGLVTVPE
ncbi:MAG: SMC-Scp complex subunit ScpB [Thermoleophilia bacterium]|nr:SMC-Scp complex subunit ScpB [Thermoleophilia bacterium]